VVSTEPVFKTFPGPGGHTLKLYYYQCGDCSADTTLSFSVAGNHVAKINYSGDPSFCDGDSLLIYSDTLDGNSWRNNGVLLSNDSGIVVKATGTYYLELGSGLCATYDSITVSTLNAAVPVISKVDTQLFSTPAASYQWSLDGSLLPGATSQFITPVQIGVYTVETTDTNGCAAVSGEFELTTIGIPDGGPNGDFVVFPNPSEGKINILISLDVATDAKVKVIDLRGAKLAEKTFKGLKAGSNSISMNLDDIHFKGNALVIIFTNEKTRTSTIVIE
jgi:hypothetical protein